MADRFAFSASAYVLWRTEVLLVFHKRYNVWLPPGGELEPGEKPSQGASRELLEETGIDLSVRELIGYDEHPVGTKGLHGNFSFVVRLDWREDRSAVQLCDEHALYRWFDLLNPATLDTVNKLPDNVQQCLLVLAEDLRAHDVLNKQQLAFAARKLASENNNDKETDNG